MIHEPYVKRWNNTFIYDKLLPMWLRRCIWCASWVLDAWWYFLLLIARLTTKWEKKTHYFAICAIFKDEALSMKEWIEYHKLIGTDHFYLYNNNSTDESVNILQPYIEAGLVTLIDWPMAPPSQVAAYQHYRDNYMGGVNFTAFIDLDEYICPKHVLDIKEWLKDYENYPSLKIYWRMFGSSGIIEHDKNKLITEQYTTAWDKLNEIGKPIVNSRFCIPDASIKHIHDIPGVVKVCGFNFYIPPINEFRYFSKFWCNRIGLGRTQDDFTLQINHYATKSYLEFFQTRRKRGDVNNFNANHQAWSYVYAQMFSIKQDMTIHRFLPFLKVEMSDGIITNYFDSK